MILNPLQRLMLIVIAVFGFFGPNGVFLYYALFCPAEMWAALAHPVTLAFVAEAFVVMFLLAVLIARRPLGLWGWQSFLVLSLLGGLGFSIPAILLLNSYSNPTRHS